MADAVAAGARTLNEVVEAAMARHRVPGLAVGILHEGVETLAGFGVTNVEHPLPVDADTIFQIASISKTFTATLTMRLVERGLIDLDSPVRRYLPEFALADEAAAAAIRVRDLFQHVGGFSGDYFDDFGRGDDALTRYVESLRGIEQVTPLGERWSYNNAAFNVAGRVVEVVTGTTFEKALRELVLDPLGLSRTFTAPEEVLTHRFVSGHVLVDDELIVVRPWGFARNCVPAFGLASTVRDLIAYARFHLGDGTTPSGERLLTPESMARLHAAARPAGTMAGHVGIAWMVDQVGGVKTVGHGGTSNGQRSQLRLVPDRQFAVVGVSNAMRGGAAVGEIVKWATEHYLGLSEPEPAHQTVDPSKLAGYAGRYRKRMGEVEVRVEDGGLVLAQLKVGGVAPVVSPNPLPAPTRLAFIGEDRVVALDGTLAGGRGEFIRTADGAVRWLHWGGRLQERV